MVGLILLLPVFLGISIWVKLDSSGSVFFKQIRVGRYGRDFVIYKFRTMIVDAEKVGLKVTVGKDPRITTPGSFIRRNKLDELPQLLNVLLGDMSLVGPRPEVPEFMCQYSADIRDKILSVRPGITDLASIEYTNEAEILAAAVDPKTAYINEVMPSKARYYLEYVENHSLILDIIIIFKTLKKIIF
ncbi:MAG: glycosyltransferase [Osedax symbiont Rs1]|nr:MAG: glycosyltransferase [Osedax symbiont Rs1]